MKSFTMVRFVSHLCLFRSSSSSGALIRLFDIKPKKRGAGKGLEILDHGFPSMSMIRRDSNQNFSRRKMANVLSTCGFRMVESSMLYEAIVRRPSRPTVTLLPSFAASFSPSRPDEICTKMHPNASSVLDTPSSTVLVFWNTNCRTQSLPSVSPATYDQLSTNPGMFNSLKLFFARAVFTCSPSTNTVR